MQHYIKNGEEYIRIMNVPNRILKLGKIKVNLQDLFKDKILNDLTNVIVNENTGLFIDDFVPKVSGSLCENNLRF